MPGFNDSRIHCGHDPAPSIEVGDRLERPNTDVRTLAAKPRGSTGVLWVLWVLLSPSHGSRSPTLSYVAIEVRLQFADQLFRIDTRAVHEARLAPPKERAADQVHAR